MVGDNKLKDFEKELVAEQPGLAISVAGVILGLFIGFTVRSALAPERILHLVEKAATHIDSHFVAHVGSASVSLSDGVFPELAVVVKDLSLESEETCWMRPVMEVDQLKLPLDLFKFFTGQIHMHEILANEVSLSLRSDLSACHKKISSTLDPNEVVREIAESVNETDQTKKDREKPSGFIHSRDSIDSVQIERIRIHYLPMTFTSFEVRHLEINLNSKNPKKLEVNGILSLNGETLSGDYSSTAFLKLNYQEDREPDWQMNLDGHWREGRYFLKSDFDSNKQYVKIHTDMEQIPLNQLFPLLRKYHLLSSDFNGRQVWLSLKGGFEGPMNGLSKVPAKIDFIRIEGNIGEIEAKKLEISKLDPFTFKPIDVDVKSLQLDSLMTFLNRPHPHAILGHLGVFHGKAHFEDSQNVTIKGENTGLEFVFSSRGVRQLQPISLLAGEILFSQGKWNIKIDRVKPVEGVFIGDLVVDADHNWSKVAVKTKIEELTLGPTVQKLITNGGEVGSIAGELQCRFEHGVVNDLAGNFSMADLSVDKLNIKKSKVSMFTINKEVFLDLKIQGAMIREGSPVHTFLYQFMDSSVPKETMDVGHASAKMKTKLLDDFHWENLYLQIGKDSLHSQGGWDHEGKLEASLSVLIAGKTKKYKLGGFRDHPIIDKLN